MSVRLFRQGLILALLVLKFGSEGVVEGFVGGVGYPTANGGKHVAQAE
jgi:hypothetical protein